MKIEDRSCNRNMTLNHRDTWIDMICKLQSCSKLKSVKGLQNETGRVLKWHIQTGPFDNITLTDAIRYLQPGFLTTIRNWKKYDMIQKCICLIFLQILFFCFIYVEICLRGGGSKHNNASIQIYEIYRIQILDTRLRH